MFVYVNVKGFLFRIFWNNLMFYCYLFSILLQYPTLGRSKNTRIDLNWMFCADHVIASDRNIYSSGLKKNTTAVLGADKEDSVVANACFITRIWDRIIMYRQVINQVQIWQDEDICWWQPQSEVVLTNKLSTDCYYENIWFTHLPAISMTSPLFN